MGPLGYVSAILCAALVFALLVVIAYTLRLRALLSKYGAVQCALRPIGGRWRTGIATFQGHAIVWYPRKAANLKPAFVFSREGLELAGSHRVPSGAGSPEMSIVDISSGGRRYELFMPTLAFAGLVSWIDAAAPSEEPTDLG
jgi:hypothetical protein